MQFTELSELSHVVGLLRVAACSSPTFHDRQDSEVDRIYNSSPKLEMQLRNSWIDKMPAFKPMAPAPPAKKSPTAAAAAAKIPAAAKGGPMDAPGARKAAAAAADGAEANGGGKTAGKDASADRQGPGKGA